MSTFPSEPASTPEAATEKQGLTRADDHCLIDTHCHLHDQEWFSPEQSEQFLAEAHVAGVEQIIVIGTDPTDSQNAYDFAAKHENVFWTYGIHPEFAGKSELWCRGERGLSADFVPSEDNRNLVAIGEIGLDYHYETDSREAQIRLFERMLELARNLDLPISLHIRERGAFADAWPILDNFPEIRGVVHSFTGSKQELCRALARDFYIGVNGLATYSTLPLPPLEKMLLETDAPFLTPTPFRGTINKPGYVREIAAYLAGEMGVAVETIAEHTTHNARQLFHFGATSLRASRSR